jgi:hypothetical protein
LHGGRIALLAVAKSLFHASPSSHITDATNQPADCSAVMCRNTSGPPTSSALVAWPGPDVCRPDNVARRAAS